MRFKRALVTGEDDCLKVNIYYLRYTITNHPLLYNTVQTDHIYLINVVGIQALLPRQQHKMLQRSQQQPLQPQQQQQSYQVENVSVKVSPDKPHPV